MPARPDLGSLHREFDQALDLARDPELQDFLTACRPASEGPDYWGRKWGIDFVEFSRAFYQPHRPDGDVALIEPVVDSGELIDLVACRIPDRRTATRQGIARALGEDWIGFCVEDGGRLVLLSDPVSWIMLRRQGAVILDWTRTEFILDGVASVLCDSRALARRVHDTTRRMAWPPRLQFSQRSTRHAA